MLGFLKDKKLKERDLQPYKYPNLRDLKKLGIKAYNMEILLNGILLNRLK